MDGAKSILPHPFAGAATCHRTTSVPRGTPCRSVVSQCATLPAAQAWWTCWPRAV